MPPKKQPLQPSITTNIPSDMVPTAGKTIEEMYQKKTQLEHILLRPDTYVGSIEKHEQTLWVYDTSGEMVNKSVSYVPGLYKIFDEILVNAADNKQRDHKMDRVEVVINQEENLISVYNTGDGIPVEIHKEEGVFVPELIFGHLLTSSNYNDNEKKTTGGRNGYGAKLTNIFSTEFIIETADGKRQLKYKQVFRNNMSNKGDPVTQKCKATENWTKVTFRPDLAKFSMTHLEDDVVALMKKRVVDLAGCLAACPGKKVKVFLNGKEIEVKSFHDYSQLYLNSANNKRDSPLPRIDNNYKEDLNPRWQISVSLSEGQFQQVSFVNNINTIKGGTHVDYITSQITKCVIDAAKKKNKNANLKPHTVKNYLWVFVNALIDNPAFDSQTKETLTTRANSFGTTCDLTDKFLKRVVETSGIVENVLTWAEFKLKKEFKKTDGSKTRRLLDVPKLEDANEAGGSKSHECTLILTEGDSAKALAMSGLSVIGRNYYGVFPLRGKMLNVREASPKQITDNIEINNLKKILGLKQGEKYDKENSIKSLRYGHLMIMADQDHDGSHIKGLIINFIHTFWPSLLRNPDFMLEFITPIVKAIRGNGKNKEVIAFYTMPEYEEWIRNTGSDLKKWTIKYYKGLGTSDANEGKEYFANLVRHRKIFAWEDDSDGSAIELAFSKKRIEARKDWLREDEVGNFLDHKEEKIKYSDFVHKELKLFSRADLQRSIPSMVDGLKPTQRKVLFAAFKKNLVKEIKVAQFSGYVSEKSSYHHGEASIQSTIVGMAQTFIGANNINLLMPNGQFGTRNLGGKDAASARYIHTRLTEITRFLFPKEDDVLLTYLKEDGLTIEPVWYMPIIPTVLVNGSEGIGTGWSTFIPNYNPRDIIANIRRLLNDEPVVPMDPWYNRFKGTIEKTARKDNGVTYTVTGIIEVVGDEDGEDVTLRITELPIRKWTQDYKDFLTSLAKEVDKKEPFIKDLWDYSTNDTVHFEFILSRTNYNLAKQEGLLKRFKLTSTLSTSNMHLFDEDNKIVKYDCPEQILEKFYHMRLAYYTKRKETFLEIYRAEMVKLDNQVRFILGVVEGDIVVCKRKKAEIVNELREKGFNPMPKQKPVEAAVVGAEDDEETESTEGQQDTPENPASTAPQLSDYDYLLSMSIGSLTIEKVKELCANRDKVLEQIEQLKKETERSLWWRDLDVLQKELDDKDKREEDEANECMTRVAASAQKAKKPRKNNRNVTKAKPVSDTLNSSTVMETGHPPELVKGKGKAAPKKAPAKKQAKPPTVVEDEEDDDIPDLRQRLAAYQLDSSPEKEAGMELDAPKHADAKVVEDISDDDGNFEPEFAEPVKKGRGRAAAGTKKRGAASKTSQAGQKLITDSFKASDTTDTSPEAKVRRMRPSPFHKKSGSVLNRMEEVEPNSEDNNKENSLDTINEVMPSRPRPQRGNRKPITYVLSDSDESQQPSDSDESQQPSSDNDEDSEFE
ncbi:DNA topoisomerase 2 isoform X1 [Beta vulgaris subsp. vulgaris]|uniref:DNA topoisomerase 2 isoform X1 n=1 Tax=Beta vulgaris subsp. vulgaris TaxID=3555 RepID=UPI00203757A1|nr:DNA topoisomerase 2 isoform X1 [Beta vulgaris subsp. vulgaris]